LSASAANGTIIHLTSGVADVYAGMPGVQTHRKLTTIGAGGTFQVSGLQPGEVLSVQGNAAFAYVLTLAQPPAPPSGRASEFVTAVCTGTPCPSGPSVSAHALVWPSSASATNARLGYTTSKPVFLAANRANGAVIWINSGSATLFAYEPQSYVERTLATVSAGNYFEVTGLGPDEVLSVLSNSSFTYQISLPDPPIEEPGELRDLVKTYWKCNTPGCTAPDWQGAAIDWPSWSAYSTNARPGNQSRTAYSQYNQELHTYMGAWADGCDVTVVAGVILIVEWERGTNSWRETYLPAGHRYVINLQGSENGAQIEGLEGSSVLLRRCTPQPLP